MSKELVAARKAVMTLRACPLLACGMGLLMLAEVGRVFEKFAANFTLMASNVTV